nr:MAG TPA: hypothetical protein [Caudoviricetes sp.]
MAAQRISIACSIWNQKFLYFKSEIPKIRTLSDLKIATIKCFKASV